MPTLSPAEFAAQGGQINQGNQDPAISAYQNFAKSISPSMVKTLAPTQPTQTTPLKAVAGVGSALGMGPLGQGLATTGRGLVNSPDQDTATQQEDIPQQFALLGQLHSMIVKGVPTTDPKRVQLENIIKQQAQNLGNGPTEGDIDAGTNLSDRDVIGSAISTAGLALGGGELAEAPAVEGAEGAEAAKDLSTGEKIVEGAKTGAKVGGVVGATQGLGSGLQNDKENALQVAGDTLKVGIGGAAGGSVIGGLIPAAIGAPKEIGEALGSEEGASQPVADTLKSRINDATPSFNKNMIGTHVMTPDITDEAGNVTKGQITPRIASESEGILGSRQPVTSASEHAAGTELNNIKNYPDNGTNLQKGLATEKAIGEEAEGLRSNLKAEDTSDPLDSKSERAKVTDYVTSHLDPEEQTKFEEGKGSKTAMGKYTAQVNEAVANYDGTREDKLNLRQELDNIYKSNRGKLAFQGDSGNILDETHTDIRDSINKDLKGSTNNTDTQASLNKQSKLYRAQEVLYNKAKAEAPNKFGRELEKAPIVGRLGNRILLREAASGIIKGAGYVGAAGLGALGYEALKKK